MYKGVYKILGGASTLYSYYLYQNTMTQPWLLDFDWLSQMTWIFSFHLWPVFLQNRFRICMSCSHAAIMHASRVSNSCVRIRYCAILRNVINELFN